MVKLNFDFFLSVAVRNLPSFAEFVLKLRVCYFPGLEAIHASILK